MNKRSREAVCRITSYNVCYTKLLRFGFDFESLSLISLWAVSNSEVGRTKRELKSSELSMLGHSRCPI